MRRKKRDLTPLWIGVGILVAMLVIFGSLAAFRTIGEGGKFSTSPAPSSGKKWTRAEARSNLVGKTKQQVKDAIGKPDSTMDMTRGRQFWLYNSTRIIWDDAAEKYISFVVEFDSEGDTPKFTSREGHESVPLMVATQAPWPCRQFSSAGQ